MDKYTTSQGHDFSTSGWLDLHFEACKNEYENMVKSLPIQPGWKILDAGCGNGRFLDILSDLITSSGEICAIDLAQENVNAVKDTISSGHFNSRVSANVGDVTSLDFPDNTFDLVWCANVTQYLDEANLNKTIEGFKRVLKPGGILAIKETDGTSYFFYPTKNFNLLWDSIKHMNSKDRQRWFDHPIELNLFLKQFGFQNTKQSTHLIERRFPLDEKTKKYLTILFKARDVNWSDIDRQTANDRQEWKRLLDNDSPSYILKQPNFFWREGHVLVLGTK